MELARDQGVARISVCHPGVEDVPDFSFCAGEGRVAGGIQGDEVVWNLVDEVG